MRCLRSSIHWRSPSRRRPTRSRIERTFGVLVSVGVLVGFVAVYAVLAPDDAVEIIYLEIEHG